MAFLVGDVGADPPHGAVPGKLSTQVCKITGIQQKRREEGRYK